MSKFSTKYLHVMYNFNGQVNAETKLKAMSFVQFCTVEEENEKCKKMNKNEQKEKEDFMNVPLFF